MSAARVIGVVGAGTMGAGIAQLAARAGARTLLHDPLPDALQEGARRVQAGLEREADKDRLSAQDAQAAAARIEAVDELAAFAPCELVIEAAPERIELKRELFARLAEIVGERCVLASNTSSLPITAIAAAVPKPERVVGMHFFNPAPLMRLLEIIAGALSDERSLQLAEETGKAMGKDTIRAADGPGFLVNRCNRPFGLEALRLLSERIADVETIDGIVRMGGGFKMGPFELSDLVGVDTGLAVSESFYELSFGEPRWRPSPIQAQRVAAGLHGRKTGRGYYDYSCDPYRPEDPAPPNGGDGEGVVAIVGESPLAYELREAAARAGYEVSSRRTTPRELAGLTVECDPDGRGLGGAHPASEPRMRHGALADSRVARRPAALAAGGHTAQRAGSGRPGSAQAQGQESGPARPERNAPRPEALRPPPPEPLYSPRILLCAAGSLGALDPDGDAVGFHAFPPLQRTSLVELTRGERSSPAAVARAERFFAALGKHTVWVADAPGLVLGRIVCQLVNEASFALGEGVGSAKDIDTGMTLGLNHPRGPLQWADEIGLDAVLGTLEALCEEYREERYRPAPELRRLVRAGRLGRKTGAGFFEYELTA
ncbi:MAG TPA: 3-hydroxyacyl-CoA dehydrogenase NAD-binding domain-containing protein [Solirubrobacteraceae bacterium]|nr:3-hydroxyacyl-CoA dehydrogenase NAD-binding domain-containing protein [Solirubrobacteraceae bacterium]